MLTSTARVLPAAILAFLLAGSLAAAAAVNPNPGVAKPHNAARSKSKQTSQAARREAETIGRAAGNNCHGTAAIPHDYGKGPVAADGDWVVLCSNGQSYRVRLAAPGVAATSAQCSLAHTSGQTWCFE